MLKVAFKVFNGLECTEPNGCSIFFDKEATFQYLPSNTSNYFITLDGEIQFNYSDGSNITSTPIYTSNNWTMYQDIWKYDVSFDAKVDSTSRFAALSLLSNTDSSHCSLKIKKVENENFSFSTDKASVLFIYGNNYQYNGNLISSNAVSKISGYGNSLGNTKTHEIVATTPLTLIFLEKQ